MSSPLALRVNGQEYSDWLNGGFWFSLDKGASTFDFTVSDRWASNFFGDVSAWEIPANSKVEFLVHGQKVLTGFVDVDSPIIDASSHTVSIGGRSATGQLEDCSLIHDSYSWSGQNMAQIAKEICAPFSIDVFDRVGDLLILPKFQVESGTTVWEVLRQLSEKSGVLIVPEFGGGLSIERTAKKTLPFSLNCKKNISVRYDMTGRYSDWIVQGQKHGYDGEGLEAGQVRGQVRDTGVPMYRPIIVNAEGETDGVTALQIAEWRKARSIGESISARVVVPDFLDPNGNIWRPNSIINVQCERGRIDRAMIISAVAFRVSGDGTICELEFKHPAAYTPKPISRQQAVGRVATAPTPLSAVDRDRVKLSNWQDYTTGNAPAGPF